MGILKIFMGPSHVFPIILHNTRLQTYTVRYKLSIKNILFPPKLQKKFKNFKNLKINFHFKKKIFCFHTYGQILKVFHAYFLKIKSYFYHVLIKYKNRYRNQFITIHQGLVKIQKKKTITIILLFGILGLSYIQEINKSSPQNGYDLTR